MFCRQQEGRRRRERPTAAVTKEETPKRKETIENRRRGLVGDRDDYVCIYSYGAVPETNTARSIPCKVATYRKAESLYTPVY